jgi:cytochrome c
MCRFIDWAPAPGLKLAGAGCVAVTIALASMATLAGNFPGIGRAATPSEIAAWDIDVRPDFKGLPAGSGSVERGQQIWEAKCMSCHGTFGESNEIFAPLVGGTTAEDIRTGRVKTLVTGDVARTTFMKLSSISTLWDYVNRAMPWNAPRSLSTDEVYAVIAYMLNLSDIVPGGFVLSDRNIADVQRRLPNRDGVTRDHGLWDVKGRPDVKNIACMKNCATEVQVSSSIPEHARGSHGDLAEQNRTVGVVRGEQAAQSVPPTKTAQAPSAHVADLVRRKACLSCHAVDRNLVGPAFREIAARYRGEDGIEARLVEKLRRGSSGTWGPGAMPADPDLAESDARMLVQWVLGDAASP